MFVPYWVITLLLSVMSDLIIKYRDEAMGVLLLSIITSFVFAQTAQVQIVHNSPSPTVDIYVDGVVAVEDVAYRASTDLVDLPINTEVGIASSDGEVIATFPFQLAENDKYVFVASGIVRDEIHSFNLLVSSLQEGNSDDQHFALKVMHGVTDSPAVDIYANGELLVENLAYGDFQGYLKVPVDDYTLDITVHGSTESIASFSAPLSTFGGVSGILYASGFLIPAELDSTLALVLTTPSGYVETLAATVTALETQNFDNTVLNSFVLLQNFPNPFNPVTSISYHLTSASTVAIIIYDLMGNVVKNLFSGIDGPGYKSINWDATNNSGDLVTSGMYFYKLQVGESFEIKRMMYLK